MATTLADAYMKLRVDTTDVEKDMVKGTDKAADNAGKSAGKSFSGSMLKGVAGLAGAVGATIGLSAGVKFFGDSIAEAKEAEKIGRLTEAVIKSTGAAANVTAIQVSNYATELSNLSGIDDEVIQGGENMLLTFTNIKNGVGAGNDIFKQATEAALNMSVAMGTDLQAASIQVGKALNDPVAGVTALRKVGVQLTEQQREQIKAFVASGDIMSAQKLILGELTTEFGGAAAAAAEPGQKAAVAWGNFKEAVGEALLPTLDKFSGFLTTTVIPGLVAMLGGIRGAEDGATGFSGTMETLGQDIRTVTDKTIDIVGWFAQHKTATELLVTAIGAYIVATRTAAAATALWTAAVAITPVGWLVIGLAAIAAGFIYLWKNVEGVSLFYTTAMHTLVTATKGLWQGVTMYVGFIIDSFRNIPEAARIAWNSLVDGFKSAMNIMIRAWNNFELRIGGGDFFGVHIPSFALTTFNIPFLADGGIVPATHGGTLALLGEAGEDEAVIPLSKMGGVGGGRTYNINVSVAPTANQAEVGREIVQAIKEFEARNTARWRA